jgi:MraZ protein
VTRVFMGEYRHSLDDKGRLFIPARMRELLGARFVITKGLDRCLFLYSGKEWEGVQERLAQLPLSSSEARAFARFFFSGASECEPDKQGRILVPGILRQYAVLQRETVIVGVATRVEIWPADGWQSYAEETQASPETLAENLGRLGLL